MSFLRTTVTGNIFLPDGSVMPDGANIIFTLRSWDKDADRGAIALHGPIVATVEDGAISVQLIRTATTDGQVTYDVGYIYRNPWTQLPEAGRLGVIAVSGAADQDIDDLLALPAPAPNVPDALALALAAAVDAMTAAQEANNAALMALVGTGVGFDSHQQVQDSTIGYGANSITQNGETVTVNVAAGDRLVAKGGVGYEVLDAEAGEFDGASGYHFLNAALVRLQALPAADGRMIASTLGGSAVVLAMVLQSNLPVTIDADQSLVGHASPISLPINKSIRGAGRDVATLTLDPASHILLNKMRAQISDLAINGNGANYVIKDTLGIASNDSVLSDLHLTNFKVAGIHLEDADASVLQNIWVEQMLTEDPSTTIGAFVIKKDARLIGCLAGSTLGPGYYISGGESSQEARVSLIADRANFCGGGLVVADNAAVVHVVVGFWEDGGETKVNGTTVKVLDYVNVPADRLASFTAKNRAAMTVQVTFLKGGQGMFAEFLAESNAIIYLRGGDMGGAAAGKKPILLWVKEDDGGTIHIVEWPTFSQSLDGRYRQILYQGAKRTTGYGIVPHCGHEIFYFDGTSTTGLTSGGDVTSFNVITTSPNFLSYGSALRLEGDGVGTNGEQRVEYTFTPGAQATGSVLLVSAIMQVRAGDGTGAFGPKLDITGDGVSLGQKVWDTDGNDANGDTLAEWTYHQHAVLINDGRDPITVTCYLNDTKSASGRVLNIDEIRGRIFPKTGPFNYEI
ncbi:hypothetical protein LCM08_13095 [Salipiger pacificus]|nr:hypothetical protein [Alloyangia pacifica]